MLTQKVLCALQAEGNRMSSSRIPGSAGFDPDKFSPLTPGPLGHNDAADPASPSWFLGDTPGALGVGDWADHDVPGGHHMLLAALGPSMPIASAARTEYAPDLGTTQQTIEMYDK